MTERLGRERTQEENAMLWLRTMASGDNDQFKVEREWCRLILAAHDALAQEVESWRILATRANERAKAAEQEVARLRDANNEADAEYEDLAEDYNLLLAKLRAAEQRAGVLASIVSEAIAMASDFGEGDLVDKWRAALTPPSQHGQATGVLQPGTLPPLEWDDKPPSQPGVKDCSDNELGPRCDWHSHHPECRWAPKEPA